MTTLAPDLLHFAGSKYHYKRLDECEFWTDPITDYEIAALEHLKI